MKKIKLFIFLIIVLFILEWASGERGTQLLLSLGITTIAELAKGVFIGTIFALFVEEHEDKK